MSGITCRGADAAAYARRTSEGSWLRRKRRQNTKQGEVVEAHLPSAARNASQGCKENARRRASRRSSRRSKILQLLALAYQAGRARRAAPDEAKRLVPRERADPGRGHRDGAAAAER